jgi:hypothetical protein
VKHFKTEALIMLAFAVGLVVLGLLMALLVPWLRA